MRGLARPNIVRALGLALGLSSAACTGGTYERGPSDALRSYSNSLQDRRVDDAYEMLSDDAKRSISLEAFRRMVLESPDDVLEVAKALARPTSDPVVTATVALPNGENLELVYEDGDWRVNRAAVDLYGQSTPRQALIGFLRAFERRRYDVVLRYVPDAEREGAFGGTARAKPPPPALPGSETAAKPDAGAPPPKPVGDAAGELTAERLRLEWEGPEKQEMGDIVAALRAALPTANIEETGDVASMSYGSGGTVSFIRERGLWKIRDF